MDDAEFHAHMNDLWVKQGREEVKNRFRISAKLTEKTYPALMQFCRERDLNINSALRLILASYFRLPNE